MAVAPTRQSERDGHEAEQIHAAADRSPPRARETLKHDDAFAIIDILGDIGAFGHRSDGLFCRDTRYLSRLELLIARNPPLILGSALDSNDLQLCSDMTNTDIYDSGVLWLHKDVVHVYRTTYVLDGALRQRLAITNHGNANLKLPVSLFFDNDFADIFEVRGMRRNRRGTVERHIASPQTVILKYTGLDAVVRQTKIEIDPKPEVLNETSALFTLDLPPKKTQRIFFTALTDISSKGAPCFYASGLRDARRSIRRSQICETEISASDPDVDAVLKRAVADLRILTTSTADGLYPYAGTPWYSTTFGRDALITALQLLWFNPSIAQGVLRRLARYQAVAFDADADAQPGKILHEMRSGEMAALREIPFGLYYGSVDSTPLFIVVAGAYVDATGDKNFLAEIWPAVLRALQWIDCHGDHDGDGFVEYARETESGLANQGWKDSHDSVFHSDGALAKGAIALVEVQGYVYAAKMAAAKMAELMAEPKLPAELRGQAEALREKFERSFWIEEIGTYALALDGEKNPTRVRSSNAGHVLCTGIAAPERANAVIDQMISPSFFTGWGIRTIAGSEARYNPMSYHNGSVWPHDNAMIAAGFARYGRARDIKILFDGLLDAALAMDQKRLPELFCGFRRRAGRTPILYPVACSPQAWASGAMIHMLSSMLGLKLDAASGTVILDGGYLPARLNEISITNLRVGEGALDLVINQNKHGLTADVRNSRGGARLQFS
jgi:glycogen debranching enzyme